MKLSELSIADLIALFNVRYINGEKNFTEEQHQAVCDEVQKRINQIDFK